MTDQIRRVPPDTGRIVEGLRDTGYTLNAAIADIVDNSITANATAINISLQLDGQRQVLIRVSDNGHGMDVAGLENAMRYGSAVREERNSLSRFGLGLKTASTSFCRRLTVVSVPTGGEDVFAAAWDLDELAEQDDWVLRIGTADSATRDSYLDEMESLAQVSGMDSSHGTVVMWDKVDRLLKTKSGSDVADRVKAKTALVSSLRDHLSTVFQRFLDPEDKRARSVAISVNGESLEPWDPFCTRHVNAEKSKEWTVRAPDGREERILLRGFILPSNSEVSDEDYRKEARISNDRQGIYLYREDRLIEGPDWLGIAKPEPHMSLLRIELSFPAPLDEVFGVGIKKSGVHLDVDFAHLLEAELSGLRREAQNRYRRGNTKQATGSGDANNPGRPTENSIKNALPVLQIPTVTSHADGSVVMDNNTGQITLVEPGGRATGELSILIDEQPSQMHVVRKESLEDGVLWAPSLGSNKVQAVVNAGHDWYRKAYIPVAGNQPLVQALEFLFYALAQAEMNNTNSQLDEAFEEFRIEVSRNLKKLVKDLPEPDEPE